MNLLLCEKHELQDASLVLTGRRARHILEVLHLGPGDRLRGGIVNGAMGTALITAVSGETVMLETRFTEQPEVTPAIHLVLALPRPIMLQRILKQAATMGIEHIDLIRSARVEKSFFQSPVLRSEKMRSLLVEGMEQAVTTRLPKVAVHQRFLPFIEDVLPGLSATTRLLAHPGAAETLAGRVLAMETVNDGMRSVILAVGPEGGWTEYEVERFSRAGFLDFSLGPRILHVDTAVLVLLAQLEVLGELRRKR